MNTSEGVQRVEVNSFNDTQITLHLQTQGCNNVHHYNHGEPPTFRFFHASISIDFRNCFLQSFQKGYFWASVVP